MEDNVVFFKKCAYLISQERKILYPPFLYNLGVLNASLSNNILYFMSFTLKLAKQEVTSKITSFLLFCCT